MVKARSDCYQDYKTIRQWAIRGFLPKKGEKGTPLWTNRHHQTAYLYFSHEQVEQATPEALKWFFQLERERRNDNARKNRKRKREQAEREQREREQAAMEAAISKAVTPLLKKQAELHEIIKGLTLDACEREWGGKKSLVIDIETTGLNPYEDEILACSIISTDGTVLFHSYVKPCAEAWLEAQDINGITPEMVKDAPTISQLRAKISKVLSQASTIIGYDTNIDLLWLVTNGITVCDYIKPWM